MVSKAKRVSKLTETVIRKKRIHTGKAVSFNEDTIRLVNGKKATREYLVHPGAVAVIPVLDDGRIVMVEQFRYPVGKTALEIPAGKLHNKKDNPLKRARAELKEETGYTAGRIKKLVSFWPCCAFSTEELHIYAAGKLKAGNACPDEDEFLRVHKISLSRALKYIKTGKIKDAKTVISILLMGQRI